MMKPSFKKLAILSAALTLLAWNPGHAVEVKKDRAKGSHQGKSRPAKTAAKVVPEGNSALHYIDARLQKLYGQDAEALEALDKAVEKDPDSPYLHAEVARHLAESEQFEQATLETDKALVLNPQDAGAHLLRGKLHSVKEESQKAIESYETCLRYDADNEECYTMLTREYLLHDNATAAMKTMQRLLKRDPSSTTGLFYVATIYGRYQKDTPKAIKFYKQALDEDPDHYKSIGGLAQIYLNEKDYENALKMLSRMDQLAPNDIETKLRIGILQYELKQYDPAIRQFSEILQLSPKNERVSYYLGILEAHEKKYEQAIEHFKSVPGDSELYKDAVIRQVVALGETGRISEAIKVTRDALKKRKDIPDLYEILASLYSREKDYPKAMQTLNRGLEQFPGQEDLLFSKGVLLDKAGKFDDSIAVMQEILKQNPENALALNYVGYSYADRGIQLQEALQLLLKADQLKPNDGYILDSLAWAYFKLGQLDKALPLLETANRLSPDEPTILEHLGDLHLKKGEREKAKSYFQEAVAAALKLKPEDKKEKDDLERIQAKLSTLNP
jgi:tetratricopeptide (TPR) repeat protein